MRVELDADLAAPSVLLPRGRFTLVTVTVPLMTVFSGSTVMLT